jgi:hypothetical protein
VLEDVVLVVEPVAAPPLPVAALVLVVALVCLLPALPPVVSSPPQAWATAKGSDTMTSVQISLRILHLLLNIRGEPDASRFCLASWREASEAFNGRPLGAAIRGCDGIDWMID